MARLPNGCFALAVTIQLCGLAEAGPRQHHARIPAAPPDRAQVAVAPPTATITADDVLSIEVLRTTPRAEQEQIIVALIADTPDTEREEKADYYFRLAQLYATQARFWRLKVVEVGADRQQTALAATKAKDYLIKAVKTYKALVENDAFVQYPKLDLALFLYGYTLETGKYMQEARAVFDKLLKNFPASKYVPEAHLLFAEHFLESNQLSDAEQRYAQVLKFPRSSAYWFAMYRVGTIHFQLQRYQEALEANFQIAQALTNDAKQRPLLAAAKQAFVRAYAAIGKPDVAYAAFARVDAKSAGAMVDALVELYRAQGKPDLAKQVSRTASPQCAVARTMTHAAQIAALEGLVQQPTCHDDAAATTGELARAYHREGAIADAERLYAIYLAASPGAPDAAEMRYFHAETLWAAAEAKPDAKAWQRTADAFADLASADLQAAIASADALIAAQELGPPPSLSKLSVHRPAPLPTRDAALVAALDDSRRDIPEADDRARVMLAEAMVLRRYHRYDEESKLLGELLANHAEVAEIEMVANLQLEALIALERYEQMLALADKLRADPQFMRGKQELERNLKFVRSRSMRRQ